jgi:hypothetical protein
MNRKIFIKTTGRILILGGLGVITGYLAGHQKVDTACSVSSACRNCRQFADCGLPLAGEARENDRMSDEQSLMGHEQQENDRKQ